MARYGKLETNSEVTDVLFAVVQNYSSPRMIQKKLNQSGSAVRGKLQFLRKNRVVIKERWNYSPDWDGISKAMMKALTLVLNDYERIKKGSTAEIKDVKVLFQKKLLGDILKSYSLIYFYGHEKMSMKDMIHTFLNYLPRVDDKRIKEINPKLLELKKILGKIPTKEELLISKL